MLVELASGRPWTRTTMRSLFILFGENRLTFRSAWDRNHSEKEQCEPNRFKLRLDFKFVTRFLTILSQSLCSLVIPLKNRCSRCFSLKKLDKSGVLVVRLS